MRTDEKENWFTLVLLFCPVVGLHPSCGAEREGSPYPGGAAEDRQRPGGLRRGHGSEEHGSGHQEQGAHWWVSCWHWIFFRCSFVVAGACGCAETFCAWAETNLRFMLLCVCQYENICCPIGEFRPVWLLKSRFFNLFIFCYGQTGVNGFVQHRTWRNSAAPTG